MQPEALAKAQAGAVAPGPSPRITWLGLLGVSLLLGFVLLLLLQAMPLATDGSAIQHGTGTASHAWAWADIRGRLLRWQPRLAFALASALALLTAAFALIAWRQLHALRLRRGALEELASKLRLAQLEAEAASQAKSTFLANMSHEIRTPFHGLMGMLSLLREAGLTARQIDYLRTATESADHLLSLLNDILDMSQLESGRLQLSSAPVNLRALLRDVEALMRPQATLKALALHIDADPAVPERVLLDATRVRQILFNLLSNAIKFSDRGAVVLDLRRRSAGPDAGGRETLEFIVTDTGAGMDASTIERLFSRFMQGDSSLQRRHGGSGLGLEISRNLARLMDGDIVVRSKPGQGSRFTFMMPLSPVPADEQAELGARAGGTGPARQLRVLVAEDHPVNRQYLSALLESQGHLTHFSSNGEEAVLAAREQTFDVVLMDVHMPVLDGIAATRAIRASSDAARAAVPIVALTADAFADTAERCMAAGMNDFLTKPVSPQGLASCLRRLFGTLSPPAAPGFSALAPEAARLAAQPSPLDGVALLDPSAMALALQAIPLPELVSMIESYLDQGPDTVHRLRAAIRGAQPLELRVHAHAAKGAALNLGLVGLAATAQALQTGAAHLPAHEIARLVQRFEEQLLATRQALGPALEAAHARASAAEAGLAPGRITR
jgi:signal transduction histidine kinase/CheY-like chemotaxis protein